MRLKTFVQISDIHMSDKSFDAKVSKLYAVVPKLDGFLGHDHKSLTMLDPFFDNLRNQEEAELILTGDLTRVGGIWEFETIKEFLDDELTPPKGQLVGLRIGWMKEDWLKLTIPGNHDRYPGLPSLVGGPTSSFGRLFSTMPRIVDVPLKSSTGHLLRFLLIDTDADVGSWSTTRAKAKGDFVTQLKTVSAMLHKPAEREIRVLCLHHSRAHRGLTLEMRRRSRNALDDFIVEQRIAVLLSGHIHEPPYAKLATSVRSTGGTATHLEITCGTTTQRSLSHLPYYWRNLLPKSKPRCRNTLFVHRLFEEANGIFWESQLYAEGKSLYEPPNSTESVNIVNPKVRIWPQPVK